MNTNNPWWYQNTYARDHLDYKNDSRMSCSHATGLSSVAHGRFKGEGKKKNPTSFPPEERAASRPVWISDSRWWDVSWTWGSYCTTCWGLVTSSLDPPWKWSGVKDIRREWTKCNVKTHGWIPAHKVLWHLKFKNTKMTWKCFIWKCFHCDSHLVAVVDIGVRQRAGHELKQHHAVAVHVRLEGIRVRILHADHLRSLDERKRSTKTLLVMGCIWKHTATLQKNPARNLENAAGSDWADHANNPALQT